MKRIIALVTLGLFLGSGVLVTVKAADEATVTATVTVQSVSVSVSDGSVSYGTLAASGTQSTLAAGVNDMQTATNDSNVTAALNIKGQNSANWTLAGTQAADQYFHKFCNDTDNDCTSTSSNYTALTTNYQTLKASVSSTGTVDFQLQVGVPSSSTNYSSQSVDVIVQAVAS